MNQDKEGALNHQLSCKICEIDSMSSAEYALHEFTKKHCDNLIRLAKNKPILKKQKTKNRIPEVEKETIKVNTVTYTGSYAKYGYFIPGEIYVRAKNLKEFNSDYNLYLQKYAESSFKDKALPTVEFQPQCTTILPFPASLPKKKKKKKSNIKICEICNVTLLTIPSYETHLKSPEHISKLKVSGMGVSAHFVKASSDLHTIEPKEYQKVNQDLISVNEILSSQNSSSEFSILHSNTNELGLNSLHQYTSYAPGKYHTDCFKKEVEDKKVLINPPSDKLFCYTCNIFLNTVFQYNEHKQGKKHKIKCRTLIRNGMTVPPEERVPGIGIPNNDPSQPVYPELYVKMILERQKKSVCLRAELGTRSDDVSPVLELSAKTDLCDQNVRLNNFNEKSEDNMVSTEVQDTINFTTKILENFSDYELPKKSNTACNKINFVPAKTNEKPYSENSLISNEAFSTNKTAEFGVNNKGPQNNITVLKNKESLHCSICNENFQWQFQFDIHLTLEEHLKKIVELKVSGKNDHEILNLIFADRNVVKPNNLGKIMCSICKVTANSKSEFEQHLSCLVHKYTEKDYKQKRTFEVKHLIPCDETGMYYCKLCKMKWASLIDFSQHFISAKHKTIQKRKRTSRSVALSERQRLSESLKRKCIMLQSLKADKKPKERKLSNDLCAGAHSEIPNLKLLESKIEPTKNINIGVNEKSDTFEAKDEFRKSNIRKRRQNLFKASVGIQRHSLKQSNSNFWPPSLLPDNFIPSRNFSRFTNRRPYGWYSPSVRNVSPLYNSHPYEFEPFYRRDFY